jgi:hypothetical protein
MKYLYPDLFIYKHLYPVPKLNSSIKKSDKIPIDKSYDIKYENNPIFDKSHRVNVSRLKVTDCNTYLECKMTFQDTNLFLAYQRENINKPLVWHVFSKDILTLNRQLKESIKKSHHIDFNKTQNSSLHGFLDIVNVDHKKAESKLTLVTTPLQRYSDYDIYKLKMAKLYASNRGGVLGMLAHNILLNGLVRLMCLKHGNTKPVYNMFSNVLCVFYSVTSLNLGLKQLLPTRVSNTIFPNLLSVVVGACVVFKFSEIAHNCMEKDLYPKISNFLVGSLAAFIAHSLINLNSIHNPNMFQLHCFKAADVVLEDQKKSDYFNK